MMVCAPTIGKTAPQDTKPCVPKNIIKISYGPAILTSNIYYGIDVYGNVPAMNFELAYSHVWNSGWGIGVQGIQSHFDVDEYSDCMNMFYFGPSVSYNYRTTKDWIWNISAGTGYANWDDVFKSHSGIGITTKLGVNYMLSHKIGVGVEATSLASWFKKPKGWSEHHHNESFGINQSGVSIGLCIFLP